MLTLFIAGYSFECNTGNIDLVNEAFSPVNDAFYYANVVYNMYTELYWLLPLDGKIIARYDYSKVIFQLEIP